jgi:pyruvate dehydrogenase E1 component beta subunit
MSTNTNNRMLTMAEAVREAMTIAMTERDDVFLLGEDVGIYGGAFGVSSEM